MSCTVCMYVVMIGYVGLCPSGDWQSGVAGTEVHETAAGDRDCISDTDQQSHCGQGRRLLVMSLAAEPVYETLMRL